MLRNGRVNGQRATAPYRSLACYVDRMTFGKSSPVSPGVMERTPEKSPRTERGNERAQLDWITSEIIVLPNGVNERANRAGW